MSESSPLCKTSSVLFHSFIFIAIIYLNEKQIPSAKDYVKFTVKENTGLDRSKLVKKPIFIICEYKSNLDSGY
jgi:hypothetical protein